ncbi:hypothetical protein BC332_13139 [Capsicum chinense]|nr:hypothetical protein BC332_13139 [Capsicum chinense]
MAEANSFAISSSFLKQVYLYDWWLIKVEIGDGCKRLGVGGFTAKERPDGRVFHSITIAKRHDTVTLVSVDGITILLSGFINRRRTLQNGFSSEVCKQFLLGFPHNWKESAALSFGESTNEDAALGISDFSESANASAGHASSSFSVSVDHLPANVLRDLLISGAGDAESGMLRKSIFNEIVQKYGNNAFNVDNEIVQKYGNNAFNVDEASTLNPISGNQVTTGSPSLNESPSRKKKGKNNWKQEDSCIPDEKSVKEDLQEVTPEDMPEKRVLDRLLHKSGGDAFIASEMSCLNQKSGDQVTTQSPSLNESCSKKKKAKTNRKQEHSFIPDAKSGKDDLQEATPKDMPEKRVSERLLLKSGVNASIVGENSCLNKKSGNQLISRGPSLDETPQKKKTAANFRKEDDNHVSNAQCGKEVLRKCNDESGAYFDKNSSSSSLLTRSKACLYKETKVYQKQEENRDVHKVASGHGDFGTVNTTSSSNGPLTRSRAKKHIKRTRSRRK